MTFRFAFALVRGVSIALLALVFTACGGKADPTPTPTSSATERPTPPPDVPGTPLPGEVTAGEIADRIRAAWGTVKTIRITRTSTITIPVASPVTSPVASPVAIGQNAVIDEIVLPDRHRVTIIEGGSVLGEIVAVDGRIYVRGSLVPGMPAARESGWHVIDLSSGATPTPLSSTFASLLQPPVPPFSQLTEQERGRIARPAGEVTVNGRTCRAFTIPASTMTGERIEVTVSLDASDRPCSITTRAGSTETVAVYEYNLPLVIDSPS